MSAPFVHRHRVRYHETDAQHHVYNSRYLEYVDVAMIEFLRDLGWPYREAVARGFDPILARAEIDFRRAAVFEDELEVAVLPRRLGNTSVDIEFRVTTADGDLVAEILVVYVNFDAQERQKLPIPAEVRARLEQLVPAEPVE